MTITETDSKYINRLFELKPDCTGKELLNFIKWLSVTDMRHYTHYEYIEKEDKMIAYVSGININ